VTVPPPTTGKQNGSQHEERGKTRQLFHRVLENTIAQGNRAIVGTEPL
jgi:hypothetical protein